MLRHLGIDGHHADRHVRASLVEIQTRSGYHVTEALVEGVENSIRERPDALHSATQTATIDSMIAVSSAECPGFS
jgi:hypothetical protein